jgi:hypothetical protein
MKLIILRLGVTTRQVPHSLFLKSESINQQNEFSSLVSQYQSIASDCPPVLLGHKKRIQVLLRTAFLLQPGSAAIARAQNRAAPPDNPAFIVADKLHAQQCRTRRRLNFRPRPPAVIGA